MVFYDTYFFAIKLRVALNPIHKFSSISFQFSPWIEIHFRRWSTLDGKSFMAYFVSDGFCVECLLYRPVLMLVTFQEINFAVEQI